MGLCVKGLDETAKISDNQVFAADVAELADAQASGACVPWDVEVRLLSSALTPPLSGKLGLFALISKHR